MIRIGARVPCVDLPFFNEAVLPQIFSARELKSIQKQLVANGDLLERPNKKRCWKGFSTINQDSDETEAVMFKPMVDIHQAIVKSVQSVIPKFKNLKPTLHFETKETLTYESEIAEDASSKSDAAGILRETTGVNKSQRTAEYDVVYPCEWKKARTTENMNDVNDNPNDSWVTH